MGAHDTQSTIESLYLPQFEQLDLRMSRRDALITARVDSDEVSGQAWVLPVSDTCVIVDHEVTPHADLAFYEAPRSAYACLCTCSEASVDVMPSCGIDHARQVAAPGPWPADAIYSFAFEHAAEARSTLRNHRCYRSRSVCLLPGFFDELARRYPGEPFDLFGAFGLAWPDEAAHAIRATLRRLDTRRMLAPGAHLFARASIDALMAELACARASQRTAVRARDTRRATQLALETTELVERMLADGRPPQVDELARLLYVSRSQLCATFTAQTGESVGAYVRRRRIERGAEALAAGVSMTKAAEVAGYATTAAFSTAFKRQMGMAPSLWGVDDCPEQTSTGRARRRSGR